MVLILCLAAVGVGFSFYRYTTTPAGTSETNVVVWIKPGQSFSETVAELQSKLGTEAVMEALISMAENKVVDIAANSK